MKSPSELRQYEIEIGPDGGAYQLPSVVDGRLLRIIASFGGGWDHVPVSRKNRCPNWQEMEQVKRIFFKEDEYAMQLHVPPTAHINFHPYCLHLWRPQNQEIPKPPTTMVTF